MSDDYRTDDRTTLRVLFCIGVRPAFFAADAQERGEVIPAIRGAFDDLHGKFGLTVLGTMDDDELMVGPSETYPWTAYILADAPDLAAVTGLCNQLREVPVGDAQLWKYLKIEARVGRALFFGNS